MASRLSGVLPKLIHHYQTGFVHSRYIGDSVRNLHSILEFLEATCRQGLLVSLDFREALFS